MDILKQAVNAKDLQEAAKKAHAIKGTSANVSAKKISSIALQLEKSAKANNLGETASSFIQLETCVIKSVTILSEYVKKSD